MSKKDKEFDYKIVFPDAVSLIKFKMLPIADIKDNCLVCIDTSVLFLPYELDKLSLAEVRKVYKFLIDRKRLVVAAHSIREFARHRTDKVAEVAKYVSDLASKQKPPLRKIGFLEENSVYIDAQRLSRQIGELGSQLAAKLTDIGNSLAAETGNDPVSSAYRELLSESIFEFDREEDDKGKFDEELELRTKLRIPPGYKDAEKDVNREGDLVIWKTLLQQASKLKRDAIFVTADNKGDWWVKAGNIDQPKFELIDEFRRKTDGRTVHIVKLSQLLGLYGASRHAIDDVRGIEQNSQEYGSLSTKTLETRNDEFMQLMAQRHRIEAEILAIMTMIDDKSIYANNNPKSFNENQSNPAHGDKTITKQKYEDMEARRRRLEYELLDIERRLKKSARLGGSEL